MRDPRLYLEDVRESCRRILRYTEALDFANFLSEEVVYDAVLRNLGIIGEAIKQLPHEVRDAYAEVDWRRIAGLRDIVVHAYFGLDDETLWDIVSNKVPSLLAQVETILDALPKSSDAAE